MRRVVVLLEDRMASSGFNGVGIVTGTIFIVIVLLFRHGIWGTARDLLARGRGRATSEALSRTCRRALAWGA